MKVGSSKKKIKNILVIDVGGTHIKVLATGQGEERKIRSGPTMTPSKMVRDVKPRTGSMAISIGYPGPVIHGHPLREPGFRKAFGCPVKIINDAAMQALGSYRGGRMLFLGLGTGLGSAMIVEGILEPMELAHLPYRKGRSYEDYLGIGGLKRLGKMKWRLYVDDVVGKLKDALKADYVVLGGGNAKLMNKLPPLTFLGDNRNAFGGGLRVWETKI
jgi:polyphosphate glucokinase